MGADRGRWGRLLPSFAASLPQACPPSSPALILLQVNKNVLVKSQVSLQSASLAAVVKSWWQPSLTLAGAASYDWGGGAPGGRGLRLGVTAAVETFSQLRCVAAVDCRMRPPPPGV